jgi:spermidine synthase
MTRQVLAILSCLLASRSIALAHEKVDYGLVDWLNAQEGGIFNPKQEIRHENPEDPTSKLGVFATERIEEGEILSQVPWSIIIDSTQEGEEAQTEIPDVLSCVTVEKLLSEMQLGDDSKYAPYVKYLLAQKDVDQIPSAWSNEGKELLVELLDGTEQWIPPRMPIQLMQDEWFRECDGDEEDTFSEDVAALVMKISTDDLMVPIYDWYTHRNGKWFNAKENDDRGVAHQMIARRAIEAGEQIHNSYDLCDGCNEFAVENGYGTPGTYTQIKIIVVVLRLHFSHNIPSSTEIFRDYGVVESMPQRWSFQPKAVELEDDEEKWLYAPEQINFELQESDEGGVEVNWATHLLFDDRGRNYIRMLFRKELRRLYRFQNVMYKLDSSEGNPGIPKEEWEKIRDFYSALKNALRYAIYSLVNDGKEAAFDTCKEGMSANEGYCPAAYIDVYGIHYDDLGYERDGLDYIFPGCEDTQLVQFYNYEDLEVVKTNYQKLTFEQRESDMDVCMNLESTLQICSNYRPHYHEFFVHFPARYLDSVKRVIFIGGGDSMLLHEVLKYPTLEKVVGLELDQQVTRKSFKYFKSQPHFDEDNVEWWYGDATKSLPLLPQDYWGSFDLVLVDLSETVMSFSVTGELDIFAALSLLLKPEGIMVKNEPYIEQFSEFFDYSIHIFYGSPKICTQVLVMGSNEVDFLHHPLKEHDVEMLLLEPIEKPEDRFKYFHDYKKTDARIQGKCKDDGSDPDATSTAHGKKAGVLDIVEAENTSVPLNEQIEEILYSVVRKEGLTPISISSSDGGATFIVMKEGYVVARMWPELSYCAFDINLWGSFQKSETLRSALVAAVGSTSISSYRIVVGGMHGANTWEDDKDVIGVQVSQIRNCETKSFEGGQEDDYSTGVQALGVAMGQTVHLLANDNLIVVVACGFKNKDECLGLDVFPGHKVVPLWACPELQNESSDSLDYSKMYDCEVDMLHQLHMIVGDDNKVRIDTFVVDISAPYSMGQIFNSIWGIKDNRNNMLKKKHIFLAPMVDPNDEPWRRNFLERYRKEKQRYALSRAELILENGSKSVELGFLSIGDRYFFKHLVALEDLTREKLASVGNYDAWVKTVTGGILYFDQEFDSRTFEPEAYDAKPAIEQASNQKPLGRQSVFQFEFSQPEDGSLMPTFDEISQFLEQTQIEVDYAPLRFDKFTDVGDGALIVSIFSEGGLVLVWDGQFHVDINLFSTDESQKKADLFVKTFANLSSLQKTLRDDQPRGIGRVVQFQKEFS